MKRNSMVAVGVLSLSLGPLAFADAERSGIEKDIDAMKDSSIHAVERPVASGKEGREASATHENDPAVITEVQKQLTERGYDAGPADGVLDAKTRAALSEFQRAEGMEPTGHLDEETFAALADMSKGETTRGAGEGAAGAEPRTDTGAIDQEDTGVIEEPEPLSNKPLREQEAR